MVKSRKRHKFVVLPLKNGEVPEWSNGLAWKASVPATVPRVRIPSSPQQRAYNNYCKPFVFLYRLCCSISATDIVPTSFLSLRTEIPENPAVAKMIYDDCIMPHAALRNDAE